MHARSLKVLTVAVKDLDQALATFQGNFGFPLSRRGADPRSSAASAYLRIGGAEVELATAGDGGGPLGEFIAERGEGLYMLKLEVDDVAAAARDLESRGLDVRVETGAASDRPVAWVSPKAANGVLIQLVQSAA